MRQRTGEQRTADPIRRLEDGATTLRRWSKRKPGAEWKWLGVSPANSTRTLEPGSLGYKYQGDQQTNNFSEYEALREGLAATWRRADSAATHLQVRGDSNMIIKQMTERASIVARGLQVSAKRAAELSRVRWVSWEHVRREKNKMADYLTNVAMDGKGARTIATPGNGTDRDRVARVRELLHSDTNDNGVAGSQAPSSWLSNMNIYTHTNCE